MPAIEQYFQRIQPFVKGCPDPGMQDALLKVSREFAQQTLIARRNAVFQSNVSLFTGVIAGNQLLVSAITQGVPKVGMLISGPGLVGNGTQITGVITPGSLYTVSPPQSIPSTSMTASQQTYDLLGTSQEEMVTIMSGEGIDQNQSKWTLSPLLPGAMNKSIGPSLPYYYQFIPYSKVALWPTPDSNLYTLNLVIAIQPSNTAMELPEELMTVYDWAICDGAIAWLMQIPSRPWSNLSLVAKYEASMQAGISRAKQDLLREFSAGGYRSRPRGFIV